MTVAAKQVVVCADDYGLSQGIDRAIERLLAAGRLGAVSCLVNAPRWADDGPALASHAGTASLGLHFNLSEGEPLSPALARHWPRLPPLSRLLLDAALHRLPAAAIAAEFDAQWQRFVDVIGRQPRHVDGHQHVHALPGVREHLVARLRTLALPPVVRDTAGLLGPGGQLKRAVIAAAGGRGLRRLLDDAGLLRNAALAGAYGFEPGDYGARMRGWLAALPARGGWLFCHPGEPGPDLPSDPIAAARSREAAYLAGPGFADDLREAGVELVAPG